MTDAEIEELQEYRRQDLRRCMRDISRHNWAAGWKVGLEHDLYLMTFHGAVADYGMGPIDRTRLERMKRLAQLTDVWWVQSEEAGQATIPLAEAERRFSKMITHDDSGAVHTMSVSEAKQIYARATASDWDPETIAPLLKGMASWYVLRLRLHPQITLVYREDEGDWELRFGETAVEFVKPAWALKPEDPSGSGSS